MGPKRGFARITGRPKDFGPNCSAVAAAPLHRRTVGRLYSSNWLLNVLYLQRCLTPLRSSHNLREPDIPVLKLRQSQIAQLEVAESASDLETMVVYIAERFPEYADEREQHRLRALVRAAVEEANTFSITGFLDVRRYLEHRLENGEGFSEQPEVAVILGDKALAGTEKMNRIDALARAIASGLADIGGLRSR